MYGRGTPPYQIVQCGLPYPVCGIQRRHDGVTLDSHPSPLYIAPSCPRFLPLVQIPRPLPHQLFKLSFHEVPRKTRSNVMAMHNFVSNITETSVAGTTDNRFGFGPPQRGGANGDNISGRGVFDKFGGNKRGGSGGSFWDDVLYRGQRAEMAHREGRGDGGGGRSGGRSGVDGDDGESGGGRGKGGDARTSGSGSPTGVGSPRDMESSQGDSSPRRDDPMREDLVAAPPQPPQLLPLSSSSSSPKASDGVPSLAHSDLFWRAAVVALVLAATNPASVGRQLWESSPTMRCLMQVIRLREVVVSSPVCVPGWGVPSFFFRSKRERYRWFRFSMYRSDKLIYIDKCFVPCLNVASALILLHTSLAFALDIVFIPGSLF